MPVVFLYQAREERRGGGAEESDAKLSYFSQRGAFGQANRLLVPTQDFECFAPEGFAGGREPNLAAVAEEQKHSKFLFQVKDGLTDGGLGDVNPAGSLREIQMLGHGSEVTQVTQFHLG